MTITVNQFPVEYREALDEVLLGSTYCGKYHVQGAEFATARQVSVPYIDFGDNPEPTTYNRFATESGATISRKVYTLDHDLEHQFYGDALDAIDETAAAATTVISEWLRTVFAPYEDKLFFQSIVTNAPKESKATYTGQTILTVDNIKSELRKVRKQFTQSGLRAGDLYMTSDALGLLEDATNRQWGNDGSINDMVGQYDGFNIYEVADDTLGTDFTAIANGTESIRYITKRAVSYLFMPGQHQKGDGWLAQMRWVFGHIALENKKVALYTHKGVAAG